MVASNTPAGNGQPNGAGSTLDRIAATISKSSVSLGSALGSALGSIFLISRPWIGALLWGALLHNPRYAGFALLGLAIGVGVGRALRVSDAHRLGGGLKANALLAALMVAWLTGMTELSLYLQVVIAAVAAATAAVLAAAIMRVLDASHFPTLVWGYCLIAGMLFTLIPEWAALAASGMQPWPVPDDALSWLHVFIRSLGSLIYSPNFVSGLFVGTAVLLWSRAMFITGMVGWLAGAGTAIAFEQLGLPHYWQPIAYNYFIAGMALGSVFFLPGRASILMAAAGGFGSALLALVLQHLLQGTASAYLPISAGLAIWAGIAALTLAGEQRVLWRNHSIELPPEEALWRTTYWSQRFGHAEPLLVVPLAGPVRIAQGFGGALSHAGLWRNALDFQRPLPADPDIEAGTSIWGAAVTAPAPGVVERVVNHITDNPLGISNFAENWGNHIIMRLDQGGWALLAHLQQGSIVVAAGMRVEIGTYLALVGNSGRSPVPHLHLQVQDSPEPGAATRPFRLANYLSSTPYHLAHYQSAAPPDETLLHWHAADVPAEGSVVTTTVANPAVHKILSGIAPGSAVWMAEVHGRVPHAFVPRHSARTLRIEVTLDAAGRHQFDAGREGRLVASLAPDAWRITDLRRVTSPLLKLLGLAVPSIPYAATTGMTWDDMAPILPAGTGAWAQLLFTPYMKRPFPLIHCRCTEQPDAPGRVIEIESIPARHQAGVPRRMTCRFDTLRGPVRMQADFKRGTVVYSLLSFEPGLPLEN